MAKKHRRLGKGILKRARRVGKLRAEVETLGAMALWARYDCHASIRQAVLRGLCNDLTAKGEKDENFTGKM